MNQTDRGLLDQLAARFEDTYFARSLGEHGLFIMPNFVATAADGRLRIELLEHVTHADEAEIRRRLGDLPYDMLAGRTTLEQLEARTGKRFPTG